MTCDQIQPLLEMFADRTLGWGTAWRVRRHLAACPACAAELAETRRLDSRVRAWRDVAAPAGLQSRIAAALPSAPPVSAPRRPVMAHRAAVGFAGVAAAAAAFFWLLPGQPGRPTVAFADVEQAMQRVEKLSWVTTSYYTDLHGNKLSTDPGGNKVSALNSARTWVRRTPAAIATLDPRTGWRELLDKRGGLFQPTEGQYQEYTLGPNTEKDIADKVEDSIRQMTQPPTDSMVSKSSGTMIVAYRGKPLHPVSSPVHITSIPVQERLVELNGRAQTLFTRDEEITFATYYPKPFNVIHVRQSMWADPVTHRITQVEIQNSGGGLGPNRQSSVLYSHFRYNQLAPPGVFDWSPPPGAKVQHMGRMPKPKRPADAHNAGVRK